jgi:alpha-glucuronidase
MRKTCLSLARFVDPQRFAQAAAFLAVQEAEAQWWRDATLAYFQSVSRRPLPAGYAPPARTLQQYESLSFPYAPGNPGWTAAPIRH